MQIWVYVVSLPFLRHVRLKHTLRPRVTPSSPLGPTQVHPLRVIFMISREAAPKLEKQPDQWSLVFHDFVAQCLTKDPKARPSARCVCVCVCVCVTVAIGAPR